MSAERPSKLEIVGGHRPPLQFDPLRELSDTEVAGGRELEDCEYLQFLARRKLRTSASTRVASRGSFPNRRADCRPRRRAWRSHYRTRLGLKDPTRTGSHSLRRTDWR